MDGDDVMQRLADGGGRPGQTKRFIRAAAASLTLAAAATAAVVCCCSATDEACSGN